MNILIVSENFLNGGLETQIKTIIDSLNKNNNFYFAIGRYNADWNLENVYTEFNFSYNSTISQFCNDVNKLVKIIQDNNIDIIHVHPFYSLFPAVFAAKICNKPIVYTYHGISSYSFPSRINDNILFSMLLDYEVDKILCVSQEGAQIIKEIILDKTKSVFLPNCVNTNSFNETKIINNKSWALISRLDFDKQKEIRLMIDAIVDLDISELHIYGTGSKEQDMKDLIHKKNLDNKIFFEGYHADLSTELKNKYNGIIGIGRSAMEAISMGYPVILLGYNKISGLIDNEVYSKIKYENFSNKLLPTISLLDLKHQIQNVYNNTDIPQFYKDFKTNFNSKTITNEYYEQLQNTMPSSTLYIKDLFESLSSLDDTALFYDSNNVYFLLKKYFYNFIRRSCQKQLFITCDTIYNKIELLNNELLEQSNKIVELNTVVSQQNNIISDLQNNTMTLTNLKRKIKYKFKH